MIKMLAVAQAAVSKAWGCDGHRAEARGFAVLDNRASGELSA